MNNAVLYIYVKYTKEINVKEMNCDVSLINHVWYPHDDCHSFLVWTRQCSESRPVITPSHCHITASSE